MKGTLEKCLVGFVFVVITLILFLFKSNTWIFGFGDNTFIVDLLGNIARTGKPLSQISATIAEWFGSILFKPAPEVCALPLSSPATPLFHYFKWHPYLVLYVLAPLSWLIAPLGALSVATALSFSSLLLAVYCISRREGGGIAATDAVRADAMY
jgi:hypothetical protein